MRFSGETKISVQRNKIEMNNNLNNKMDTNSKIDKHLYTNIIFKKI